MHSHKSIFHSKYNQETCENNKGETTERITTENEGLEQDFSFISYEMLCTPKIYFKLNISKQNAFKTKNILSCMHVLSVDCIHIFLFHFSSSFTPLPWNRLYRV